MKNFLIYGSCGLALLVISVVCLQLRKRKARPCKAAVPDGEDRKAEENYIKKTTTEQSEVHIDNSVSSVDQPIEPNLEKSEEVVHSERPSLDETVKCLNDENLKELVKERLEDMKMAESDVQEWALMAIDLYDELNLMLKSYSKEDEEYMNVIIHILLNSLKEKDCELIDDDVWEPTRQRAIKVEKNRPEGEPPVILSKGRSGLILNGRLIRKQEVTINISKNN